MVKLSSNVILKLQEKKVFFEDYFNIRDALPRVESVKISYALDEAMENWGLVVYKGDNFIKSHIVAHEISHFWFGNLVTSKNFAE